MAVATRGRGLPGVLRRLATSPAASPAARSPFAYGKPNFAAVRESGSFFVDNTRVIRTLYHLNADVAILQRPPRFGKSLMLSTMEAYYDAANSSEQRARLFRGLDIEREPVPGAGKYFVLRWDFSVDVGGDKDAIAARLHDEINERIVETAEKYNLGTTTTLGGKGVRLVQGDSLASFSSLCRIVAFTGRPLMLLIDEYDRFANKLLFENSSMYNAVVAGTSGERGSSMLRSIFESVKKATGHFGLSRDDQLPFRVLTVGLSPMALADASGANNFKDVTFEPDLADALGFNKANLEAGMRLLVESGRVTADQVQPLLALMEQYYNGYKFHPEQQQRLYNPTLCLRLFDLLWRQSGLATKLLAGPRDIESMMNDKNVQISDNVLDMLAHNRHMDALTTDLRNGPVVVVVVSGSWHTFTLLL